MHYYLLQLIPPRATFATDMTDTERAVMGRHAEYWGRLNGEKLVLFYGPVNDPKGAWGVAVVALADGQTPEEIRAGDPVYRDGLGFDYRILPMIQALGSAVETSS
jgi:uncharacterized protein YciI